MGRKPKEPTMKLSTYLSNYSKKRNLDKVIIKWYQRIDERDNPRTKKEWDELMKKFFGETEK